MRVNTPKPSEITATDRIRFDPSFGPYIRFLLGKMENILDIRAKFYKYIISKFERHPELTGPLASPEVLQQHDEIIQLMRMSLLPLAAHSHDFMMALAFMRPPQIFYCTEPFKIALTDNKVDFNTKADETGNLRYLIKLILEKCYDITVDDDHKIIKQVYNSERHIVKHHHLIIDSRFVEVHTDEMLPDFSDSWLDMLSSGNEEFIKSLAEFPLEQFRFEGFCILYVEDVSKDVALSDLKNAILNMHAVELEETLDRVEACVGELINDTRVKVGVVPFLKVNGRVVFDRLMMAQCGHIKSENQNDELSKFIEFLYKEFSVNPQPYIFSIPDDALINGRPYIADLLQDGIKSFMAYPITTREGLLGVFILESDEENVISYKTIDHLQQAFPIITDLIFYLIKSFDDKIDALVKEKFTSLQQSVEWKFNEVAWEYLIKEPGDNDDNHIGDIVFDQVHPIYGAVDIRNSSTERNIALRKDYVYQLTVTKALLEKTAEHTSLPLLEGIQYSCERFIELTAQSLSAEDELHINEFLGNEVRSFLKYLLANNSEYTDEIKVYLQNTDEEKGMFFLNRGAYETTLTIINKNTVSAIEEEIKKLQDVYPFYFEKYRSDGVEYNIYIGQSIVPSKPYDVLYLKNIRLWQLRSMAGIAVLNNKMLGVMPLQLQTTQLILVHSNTIDISFRKDERRFDVEGSYNIRYEIIKKRIDKVRVKGSLERLTQPGYIAIVYTNIKEVDEYLEHIKFLQNKGLLTDVIEMLDLEELQGVTGLKAIRIGVKYPV